MILSRRDVTGGQGFGQQILNVVHLGAAAAQDLDKCVVLALRLLDPEHVVEEQIVVVARRQSLQTQLGPVNDDLAQRSDFRMNPIRRSL